MHRTIKRERLAEAMLRSMPGSAELTFCSLHDLHQCGISLLTENQRRGTARYQAEQLSITVYNG